MVFMSRRCSFPLASPYSLLSRPCSSPSSRNNEFNLSMEAPSSSRSNSSSPEDIAHSNERAEGAPPSTAPGEATSSSGSTPRARASLRSVPKWGRKILPLSIPETVVGLTPASAASRAWVHIRLSRMTTNLLPTVSLSTLNLSRQALYTLTYTCQKLKFLTQNCLQTVIGGYNRGRKRGSSW